MLTIVALLPTEGLGGQSEATDDALNRTEGTEGPLGHCPTWALQTPPEVGLDAGFRRVHTFVGNSAVLPGTIISRPLWFALHLVLLGLEVTVQGGASSPHPAH